MKRSHMFAALAAALLGSTVLAAPTAIYTTFGSLAPVPGGGGETFVSFDRPVRSQSGNHWMLLTRSSNPTSSDAAYITGQGLLGTVRIREGVTPIDGARVAENMSDRRCGINDSGDWAVPLDLTPSGTQPDDRIVLRGSAGGALTIVTREGQPVPAASGVPAGAVYGSSSDSVQIKNNGVATYFATIAGSGITTSSDGSGFLANGSISVREGTGIFGTLTNSSFYTNAAGDKWSIQGTIAGAPASSDAAFFVDGAIALREGDAIAGVPSTISSFYLPEMNSSGDWLARGRNADGTGWAMRSGTVLAKTGDAVPGGEAGETWSSAPWTFATDPTFFHLSANDVGDFILGGFTSNPDGSRNAVWVLNNSEVVLRNGDPVDANGDGLLNDDAFITFTGLSGASPSSLGGVLTDDLGFYFEVALRNASGAALGNAFVYVQVPEPASAVLLTLSLLVTRRR